MLNRKNSIKIKKLISRSEFQNIKKMCSIFHKDIESITEYTDYKVENKAADIRNLIKIQDEELNLRKSYTQVKYCQRD